MKDPRKVRQTIQAILAVALIVVPWIISTVEPYPKLRGLASGLGVLLALLTNPRLVAVLDALMPAAGSSAAKPDSVVVVQQPLAVDAPKDKQP